MKIEFIPNSDLIYRRIHKVFFRDGEIAAGAFSPYNGSISVDWSKYSSPKESLDRCKIISDNGILSLLVGSVRELGEVDVIHSPSKNNKSHSKLTESNTELRLKLTDICKWEIPIP